MNAKLKETIISEVDKLQDDIISTLQQIVQIPSVTGNESMAQEFLRQLYDASGLDVHSMTFNRANIENHPAFGELLNSPLIPRHNLFYPPA